MVVCKLPGTMESGKRGTHYDRKKGIIESQFVWIRAAIFVFAPSSRGACDEVDSVSVKV